MNGLPSSGTGWAWLPSVFGLTSTYLREKRTSFCPHSRVEDPRLRLPGPGWPTEAMVMGALGASPGLQALPCALGGWEPGPPGVRGAAASGRKERGSVLGGREEGMLGRKRHTPRGQPALPWEWWAVPGVECPPAHLLPPGSPSRGGSCTWALSSVCVPRRHLFLAPVLPWVWAVEGETGAGRSCWAGSGSCIAPRWPHDQPGLLTCPVAGVSCTSWPPCPELARAALHGQVSSPLPTRLAIP